MREITPAQRTAAKNEQKRRDFERKQKALFPASSVDLLIYSAYLAVEAAHGVPYFPRAA